MNRKRTINSFSVRNITIFENMGCNDCMETWAKPIKTEYETTPRIKVFKKIENDIYVTDGVEHIIEYGLVNDTLKEISHKLEPLK